jgi:hypothetical protein
VLQRAPRIRVDELPGGDEVSGHDVGIDLAQGAEFGAHATLEQGGVDVVR